jgi:hypothetical protein
MKKILIISGGDIGKHFIQRAIETYTSENIYYVVEQKANTYKDVNPARFKFFEFDTTSLYKLSNLLKMEFIQVFIAVENQIDAEHTIKNIRLVKKQLRIILLNRWNLSNRDPNVVLVNSKELVASRLLDYLPNVPVIAQNVGMGEGEIMEVLVPFGSSFVYKHIGVIEQKNWRIVAIYRNRKLIMPSRRKLIQPNDLLLLVGEPTVLKSVYRAIKRELGQFPEPFGSNLYLYLDMNKVKKTDIKELVNKAIYVQKHFKYNLIIKIFNPSNFEVLRYIKDLRTYKIIVNIEYKKENLQDVFLKDINSYHVGLIIVGKEMFANHKCRKLLYDTHLPVLKIADKSFLDLKDVSLILNDNKDLEKVSTNIFDISAQMDLNMEMYNYEHEHQENIEEVIEHYTNLSNIFSKSIKVHNTSENPLRILRQKENFMHIVPFTKKIVPKHIYSLFSTDSEKLYYKLDNYHQIFIPIEL